MNFQDIEEISKNSYNQSVTHPMQAFEWGEFRKKTGVKVVRRGVVNERIVTNGYQTTIHQTPILPYFIGYLPKGSVPSRDMLIDLKDMGRTNKLSYIQLEPNVLVSEKSKFNNLDLKDSFHPLFTKYSFILDLTLSEDQLLKNMNQKTRYNVRLAQKKRSEGRN